MKKHIVIIAGLVMFSLSQAAQNQREASARVTESFNKISRKHGKLGFFKHIPMRCELSPPLPSINQIDLKPRIRKRFELVLDVRHFQKLVSQIF